MAEASKDSGYVDNWQTGKTVTECNLHMLTTEDCSDVIFRVGSEKRVVRAHRYVLVSRSCVFHAMFCGPLAEKGEVTIPDIEIEVFREFLRYLYTDTANITADNVTGLLYSSRKYAVDTLLNQCATFLEKYISEENVCQILEQCHGYGELDLEQKALRMLTEAGKAVIKSAGFLDLCSSCLEKFLKSNELQLKEESVFEATLSWAKEKCRKEAVSSKPENIRKFLGEMIYEIRFTSLSPDYLVRVVGPSHILTAEERMNIVDRCVKSDVDITPFNYAPRKNSPEDTQPDQYVSRFMDCCVASTGLRCKSRTDAISFSANSDIKLVGCRLYGSVNMSESSYCLQIRLYDDQDQMIAEPVPKEVSSLRGKKKLNDVLFPEPVPLLAGRYYTICVNMTGGNIDFGEGGQTSVKVNEVEFSFRHSHKSVSNPRSTTEQSRQIPGLIWQHHSKQ